VPRINKITIAETIMTSPGNMKLYLVAVEQVLDLGGCAGLQQRQREQDPRLLWVEFVRSYEAQFIIVDLYVSTDCSHCHSAASYDNNTFLSRSGGSLQGDLVHIAVAHSGDDDPFGSIGR
jgi:hypothetical protein